MIREYTNLMYIDMILIQNDTVCYKIFGEQATKELPLGGKYLAWKKLKFKKPERYHQRCSCKENSLLEN